MRGKQSDRREEKGRPDGTDGQNIMERERERDNSYLSPVALHKDHGEGEVGGG